jgi:hypothetical protein
MIPGASDSIPRNSGTERGVPTGGIYAKPIPSKLLCFGEVLKQQASLFDQIQPILPLLFFILFKPKCKKLSSNIRKKNKRKNQFKRCTFRLGLK